MKNKQIEKMIMKRKWKQNDNLPSNLLVKLHAKIHFFFFVGVLKKKMINKKLRLVSLIKLCCLHNSVRMVRSLDYGFKMKIKMFLLRFLARKCQTVNANRFSFF